MMGKTVKAIGKRIWKDVLTYKEAILIFAVYYIVVHAVFHAFCPLVLVTGFPCAGCGMTRAVFFLLTGQFARSFRLNPMALPVILFAAYCFWCRYIKGAKIKGFKQGLVLILIGLLAAYIYGMWTVFPNRPPYVYTGGNLLEQCFPFYREFLYRVLGI